MTYLPNRAETDNGHVNLGVFFTVPLGSETIPWRVQALAQKSCFAS